MRWLMKQGFTRRKKFWWLFLIISASYSYFPWIFHVDEPEMLDINSTL